MEPVVAVGVSFLVAGTIAPLLVRFAVGRNLLDVPNLRSSHEVPTPRLGGVAAIAGAWAGTLAMGSTTTWPLLLAATLIGIVGLTDDLSNLHFGPKAAAQTIAAAGLIILYPPQILSGAPGTMKVVVFIVGVLWIVSLSNAFNFMDGIDGIIGGTAVISALFLAPLVGSAGAFLPALAGAAAGFLIWNMSPASIFLGDAGSYFLGFALAASALYASVPGTSGEWSPLGFVACVLVFTPCLFDTAYTLIRRRRAGKNIFTAHREHIYQRITPATSVHRRTSNLYFLASAVSGFAALLVFEGGAFAIAGVALTLALCAALSALPRMFGAR